MLMSEYQLDFAECPAGHLTPIQPSLPQSAEAYRKSIEAGELPISIACMRCDRVYTARSLNSRPSSYGLLPYHPEAQLRVSLVSIPCDDANCETPFQVVAIAKDGINVADLSSRWLWAAGEDESCPEGHTVSLPPYQSP